MKSRIDVDLFADVEDLEDAVRSAWDTVTQFEINQLVMGFEHRVKKMVDRKSESTNVKRCYTER